VDEYQFIEAGAEEKRLKQVSIMMTISHNRTEEKNFSLQ
jgi:hypothetical protein